MSTHRQVVKTPNQEQGGQSSNHEPPLSPVQCELRLGPPRSPPHAPTDFQIIGTPRRTGRTLSTGSGRPTILNSSGEIVAPFRLQNGRPFIPLGAGGEYGCIHFLPFNLPQSYPPPDLANNESPTYNQQVIRARTQRTRATNVERAADSSRNQRRRLNLNLQPPGANFEGSSSSMLNVEPVAPPQRAPNPTVPALTCPICLSPFDENTTTTKCGHVFCDGCIRMAITAQAKCPVCRCKVTQRSLLKIYLSTS